MIYSVYQHWDPLKVCVVGRSYPPEFYSWIKVPRVRSLFEKIAQETEEDYQAIIKKLHEFDVEILRPELPKNIIEGDPFIPPPMAPRDHMVMIGDAFYENYSQKENKLNFYNRVRDSTWPILSDIRHFHQLPGWIRKECAEVHKINFFMYSEYDKIFDHIEQNDNKIIRNQFKEISGASVSRIGKDLYFGTASYDQDQLSLKNLVDSEFKNTRNHIVNTGGHSDGTYCPVCPGLIISLYDVPTYADTFPDWEVVYLPGQSWSAVAEFTTLKNKNQGRWWIPGFEKDQDVVDVVETWLKHWTGYVEETVFDVNMLIIDPKNVMVFNYNKQVFDALNRYGITPHVVTFRHRYFWDGGIHCVTTDLHRTGIMQDYFTNCISH